MREIKFRGKTKDGRWVQGVPIKNGFGKLTFMCFATSDLLSCPMEQIYKFCIEVIPETVTRYTGLKDKNGIEIYEGDILKIESPNGPFMGKVVNSIGTYGVVAHGVFDGRRQVCDYFPDNWNDDYLTLLDIYWDNNDDDDILETVKVMGNRYENPELLKEEPTC